MLSEATLSYAFPIMAFYPGWGLSNSFFKLKHTSSSQKIPRPGSNATFTNFLHSSNLWTTRYWTKKNICHASDKKFEDMYYQMKISFQDYWHEIALELAWILIAFAVKTVLSKNRCLVSFKAQQIKKIPTNNIRFFNFILILVLVHNILI